MKRPLILKAFGLRRAQPTPRDHGSDLSPADEHVPVNLSAVRWVLAATLLFWLIVFSAGVHFLRAAGV